MIDFSGRVRFRRRFGYPGRIDAYERVWLTFEGVSGDADIRLNDRLLGSHKDSTGAFEFEVTPFLQPRNELVVDVEGNTGQGGLWGEVALEVRCTAYLRGLCFVHTLTRDGAEIRVSGQVAGTADGPLELYVVLDRSVAAYQVVTATAGGQSFEIVVPVVARQHEFGPGGRVRGAVVQVDLVNRASVWYTNTAEVLFEPISDLGG